MSMSHERVALHAATSLAADVPGSAVPNGSMLDAACSLIAARQNVSPKRLLEPGPSAEQLNCLLTAAAAAPDHGLLQPWRFVIIPQAKRTLLAEAFALALIDRDPGSTLEQIEAAREKAHRSPLLMLAIVRLASEREPSIHDAERLVSLGGALQNLQLAAYAMGFGSGLVSGQAMDSPRIRTLFRLEGCEQAVCFVNVGTVEKRKPPRTRPLAAMIVSEL